MITTFGTQFSNRNLNNIMHSIHDTNGKLCNKLCLKNSSSILIHIFSNTMFASSHMCPMGLSNRRFYEHGIRNSSATARTQTRTLLRDALLFHIMVMASHNNLATVNDVINQHNMNSRQLSSSPPLLQSM